MKRKILKYSSVFSLWFAGLALITHLLLPHDHHIADTFSNQDENCPASNEKSHHHPGFPVHCHAFNELTSVKAIIYFVSKYIQDDNISTGDCPDSFTFSLPVSGVKITNNPIPVPASYLPGLSPLRAPPSLI
jgi:hypothetical protein